MFEPNKPKSYSAITYPWPVARINVTMGQHIHRPVWIYTRPSRVLRFVEIQHKRPFARRLVKDGELRPYFVRTLRIQADPALVGRPRKFDREAAVHAVALWLVGVCGVKDECC